MNFCILWAILDNSSCLGIHTLCRPWSLVHWQIFSNFARRGHIRKTSNFDPTFGKRTPPHQVSSTPYFLHSLPVSFPSRKFLEMPAMQAKLKSSFASFDLIRCVQINGLLRYMKHIVNIKILFVWWYKSIQLCWRRISDTLRLWWSWYHLKRVVIKWD